MSTFMNRVCATCSYSSQSDLVPKKVSPCHPFSNECDKTAEWVCFEYDIKAMFQEIPGHESGNALQLKIGVQDKRSNEPNANRKKWTMCPRDNLHDVQGIFACYTVQPQSSHNSM